MSTLEYLDDSDWSIDLSDEPTHSWTIYVGIILLVLFVVGYKAFDMWTRPPQVHFNLYPPMPVYTEPETDKILGQIGLGGPWISRCLMVDGRNGIVQPNYGNPICTKEEARKHGWLAGEVEGVH